MRERLVVFTYYDYLKYRKLYFKQKQNLMILKDKEEKYIVDKEHDKIFKTIFENKEEVEKFINKTLKLKNKVKQEQLEKYNSSYITRAFQSQEADIVYKVKDRNIFFLIEHQSTVDYSMPFRILMYQVEIMRSAIDITKIKTKDYKMPLVIPIVLYTGKQKWKAGEVLRNSQEIWEEGITPELSKFNLVDINNLEKEKLLAEESLVSKILVLEKTKNSKEMTEVIKEIMPKIKEEQKDLMKRMISLILIRKIGKDRVNEILEKEKGGERDMLAVLDMIDKENEMYINKREKNWKTRRKTRRQKRRKTANYHRNVEK